MLTRILAFLEKIHRQETQLPEIRVSIDYTNE
jgi:hypothetical protein